MRGTAPAAAMHSFSSSSASHSVAASAGPSVTPAPSSGSNSSSSSSSSSWVAVLGARDTPAASVASQQLALRLQRVHTRSKAILQQLRVQQHGKQCMGRLEKQAEAQLEAHLRRLQLNGGETSDADAAAAATMSDDAANCLVDDDDDATTAATAASSAQFPPIVPVQPLRIFLTDVQQLLQLLSSLNPPLRGELRPPLLSSSLPAGANSSDPACVPLGDQLVLPLPTRFLLQGVPLLPSLLQLLASTLPVPDHAILRQVLQLLEQLFLLSDAHWAGWRSLIAPQAQPQHSGPPPPPQQAFNGFYRPSVMPPPPPARAPAPATTVPLQAPDWRMLRWLESTLQSMDRALRRACFDGDEGQEGGVGRPICTGLHAGPANAAAGVQQQNARLKQVIIQLRAFLNSMDEGGSGNTSTAPTSAARPQPSLLERVCTQLLQHWRAHAADVELLSRHLAAKKPNSSPSSTGDWATQIALLPDSFFWTVCQCIDVDSHPSTGAAATAAASAGAGSIPSRPLSQGGSDALLRLLDPVVLHACTHFTAYQKRRTSSLASCSSSSSNTHVVQHPQQHASVNYFLHLIGLNASRLLPSLSAATRCAFFAHAPAVFESQLLSTIRRIAVASQPLPAVHDRAHQLDFEMRALLGVENEADPATAAAANPAFGQPSKQLASPGSVNAVISAVLSPFLQFQPALAASLPAGAGAGIAGEAPRVLVLPVTLWRHHASPALYRHALHIVERLVILSNSEVSMSVLHWISCALEHCLQRQPPGINRAAPEAKRPPLRLRLLASELALHSPSRDSGCCFLSLEELVRIAAVVEQVHFDLSDAQATEKSATGGAMEEEKTNSSADGTGDASSHLQHARTVWLLLARHAHWLDFASALFATTTSTGASLSETHVSALCALLAFSLAPCDASLATRLRELLINIRRQLLLLPPSPSAVGAAQQQPIVQVLEMLQRELGTDDELCLRVGSLLAPLLTEDAIKPWWQFLAHTPLQSPPSPAAAPLPRLQRVCQHIFSSIMRWTRGAMLLLSASPPSPSLSSASSASTPAAAGTNNLTDDAKETAAAAAADSLRALQLALAIPAISLAHVLRGISRAAKALDVKAPVAVLHKRLAQLHEISTSVKKRSHA